MQETIELISLMATVPTILLAFVVISTFAPSLAAKFNKLDRKDWLILGICISYCGQFLDNSYWQVAWTLDFLHHPTSGKVFQYGAWANIFFRQATGVISASCHLRSAYLAYHETRSPDHNTKWDVWFFHSVFLLSCGAGLVYGAVLFWAKI